MPTFREREYPSLTSTGLCALLALAVAACNDSAPRLRLPTAADFGSAPPSSTPPANYVGDATVLSKSGSGGCGWGTEVGATRAGVYWSVTIEGALIELDEDMQNWPTDHTPYRGTLEGRTFVASYETGDDYLRWTCQFREATLIGSFSEELESFEALETMFWGPPENETKVERSWRVERLP